MGTHDEIDDGDLAEGEELHPDYDGPAEPDGAPDPAEAEDGDED